MTQPTGGTYTATALHFYIIMLNVNPGLTISDVQETLKGHMHWYRIGNNVWVVHTPLGKEYIYNLLFKLAYPSGTLFISRLDINEHNGLLPKPFWEWLSTRKLIGVLGV